MVPMKDLAAVFAAAHCRNVQTYIQSGNVMFQAEAGETELQLALERRIEKKFGFAVPVILRSAAELQAVIANSPFVPRCLPIERLHVLFLHGAPKPGGIESLDPDRSPPDEFLATGREVYLYLPNGAGTTKLSNLYFDSKLGTVCTGRNWRTTMKLLELTRLSKPTPQV
jgi:uncharacterized protein (DUF1697 family)